MYQLEFINIRIKKFLWNMLDILLLIKNFKIYYNPFNLVIKNILWSQFFFFNGCKSPMNRKKKKNLMPIDGYLILGRNLKPAHVIFSTTFYECQNKGKQNWKINQFLNDLRSRSFGIFGYIDRFSTQLLNPIPQMD